MFFCEAHSSNDDILMWAHSLISSCEQHWEVKLQNEKLIPESFNKCT